LAKEPSSVNPITRLFKPDPYRELFHSLADSLDDAVVVVDGSEPYIITCNHEFLLLTGYSRKELDDLTLSELLITSNADPMEMISSCWENPDCEFEDVSLKTRTDELVFVDIEAHPISPPRTSIMLILRRSSMRTSKISKQLAERERMNLLVQIGNLVLEEEDAAIPSVLDLARNLLRATCVATYHVSSNSPNYVLNGSLPAEFPENIPASSIGHLTKFTFWKLGQRTKNDLHKSARAADLEVLHTTLIGEPNAWVGLLVVGWENAVDVPEDSEPLAQVIGSFTHVATLLSVLRSSIAESKEDIRGLETELDGHHRAISDTIITVDSDLRVLRANPAVSRLLGYQPAELLRLDIQDVLVGPEDVTTTLLDALGHHREAERTRLILHHRDGTPLPVHLRAVPITTHEHTFLIIVLQDQSEQQAIEDQTEILSQRALLGEVTAIFAHEVRNPINNISTGVQLVASRLGKEHPQYNALERVQQECIRLDQLMSDVLFFARPLELKMQSIDLAELVERILARWSPRLAQSNVRCHTNFDPEVPPTSADPRTLERVVVNLISNAVEAMIDGGTLSFTIAYVDETSRDLVELKVADTGPGIPPDKIDRIFDPFFTTKKDGTGLGLAISRRILSAHKGNMQVESFPDAGTVFTIQLPVADA